MFQVTINDEGKQRFVNQLLQAMIHEREARDRDDSSDANFHYGKQRGVIAAIWAMFGDHVEWEIRDRANDALTNWKDLSEEEKSVFQIDSLIDFN